MVDIKGYKCPNCNGIIRFDISTQMAKCQSCGAEFGRSALESYQWGNEDVFDCTGTGGNIEWRPRSKRCSEKPFAATIPSPSWSPR